MSKDRDDHQPNQEEFSLESILAEFGSGRPPQQPEEDPPAVFAAPERESTPPEPDPAWKDETIPFPLVHPSAPSPPKKGRTGVVTAFPGRPPIPQEELSEDRENEEDDQDAFPLLPDQEEEEEPSDSLDDTKVLEFPSPEPQPENPVAAGLGKLRRKADEFADHMYEEEGMESAASVRRAEKLIPGVDEEELPPPVRERKPRKAAPPPPDLSPAELTRRYAKGFKAARVRNILFFLLLLPLFYLTLVPEFSLPLPPMLVGNTALLCYLPAGLQAVGILLAVDCFLRGLVRPFQGRTGMDTITALANLAVLADALSLPTLLGGELIRQPLCAPAALCLWFVQLGDLKKRQGQRTACRTAASASEPYLVTRDEGTWNGRDTYAKWSGPPAGFGSQIQTLDGAERIYRVMCPLLLLASVLFSLIASVGHHRPENLLWCLSSILTAASSLSATLAFGLPWKKLSARLSKSGAALAGWEGVTNTTGASNLLLTDIDLFPVGSVSLNGVKIFGDFPIDKVVALTASAIRDSGCGLEKVFYDLLRSRGSLYRRGEHFTAYEGGGVSEMFRGEMVLVGSAPFMVLMDVALPPGLNVKNAVFCAIDGELAGIFALNYQLPGTVAPAMDSLIHNRITPVLATRDFNLIPSMLRQRFKLPVDKLEFPAIERRRELSAPDQEHSATLAAVLCREGVGPYAEAVVGSRRLRSAVRLSAVLACLGSVAGSLLTFYLTFMAAYGSLTPLNLLVFLLMWLVPTPLISGWVDRY